MISRHIEPEFSDLSSPVTSHCVHQCFPKIYYLVLTEEQRFKMICSAAETQRFQV